MRLVFALVLAAVPGDPPAPHPMNQPAPPPKAVNAWTAGEGFFADRPEVWRQTHDWYVQRAKMGDADVVFLGDSLTQWWDGPGRAVWAARVAPLNCVNFGLSGDTTSQILWRLDHGTLDGLSPKVVVLLIGTNNRQDGTDAPADVARGIRASVDAIREKAPAARVLLFDVFPAGRRATDAGRKFLAAVNAELGTAPWPAGVTRLDIGPRFLAADGRTIPPDVMPDALHLAEKGYAIWADALVPALRKLLAAE